MFISGLTQFIAVDKKIQVAESDKKEFVKAVLELSPFKKQFNYGDIQIYCISPTLSEYVLLEKIPEPFDYEDCFALIVLEKIYIKNKIIYQKGQDISENYAKLNQCINSSPITAFIAKSVTQFYLLFKELMKQCGDPNFFG